MSASTAEERAQKIKQPPAEVSISPGGKRFLLEAAGFRQRLHLWNHGSSTERLAEAGGVIIVGFELSAVGGRHSRKKL